MMQGLALLKEHVPLITLTFKLRTFYVEKWSSNHFDQTLKIMLYMVLLGIARAHTIS